MAIKSKRPSEVKPESPAEKRVKFDKSNSTSGPKKSFTKPGGKYTEFIKIRLRYPAGVDWCFDLKKSKKIWWHWNIQEGKSEIPKQQKIRQQIVQQ